MAEAAVETSPLESAQDVQIKNTSLPIKRNPSCKSLGQKCLLLLMGLIMLGLVVERYLIYNKLHRIETFLCKSHNLNKDLSSWDTSGDQTLKIASENVSQDGPQKKSKDLVPNLEQAQGRPIAQLTESKDMEPDLEQAQGRPFAHLTGYQTPGGEDNVVQWTIETNTSQSFIHNMGYRNGRLLVEREGYYYLYSKVTFNALEECSLIQHKVIRHTKAYGIPIELMRSKSFRCLKGRQNRKSSDGTDLRNSFLAGIFHLKKEDEIFVRLENINKIHPGDTDNSMGAFMIYP